MTKAMVVLIDGASAEYLTSSAAPNINRLASQTAGFYQTVIAQLPSVTNVNHARILTGEFPDVNGINGNIFFDRASGEQTYIESPVYLNAPTIFTRLAQQHQTSALLTVKGKIDQVFGSDATYRFNAEKPDAAQLAAIDAQLPPDINSLASGQWVFATAQRLIQATSPDFVYATTNDFVMHHFAPETPEARQFIAGIDQTVAAIHALEPERTIFVTADHGMNAKPTLINLERWLAERQLTVNVLLPLADRYLKNHQYQESGTAYIYCHDAAQTSDVQRVLTQLPGVEQVLTKTEAVQQYHLAADRIGDLVVLANQDTAFGLQPESILHGYQGRSHGSRHELTVPLFCLTNQPVTPADYQTSRDIFTGLKALLHF
ncbi:alkaline phosphatase family protein [Lactiplantibacillus carotarum]|uniref:alkaline phosphatase family protein n=1 Tax=Lactiplantibacillus carotarum TaxID=2993456 RepID=UPI00298EDA0B|nr:alkaline phosphatase family protein [Lactiplantibacillus carotarum]